MPIINHRFLVATLVYLVFSVSASAVTVNRLNGGLNLSNIDFSIKTSTVPLELFRTYSSITAMNEQNGWYGVFGWGWTAPFETTLTTTPERLAILRDGASGNNIIFKPKNENPKDKAAFFEKFKRAYFERERKQKISNEELQKLNLPQKLLTNLSNDPKFRIEMSLQYGIGGQIPTGELLVSSEYGYQTLVFRNGTWLRDKDGVTQLFDAKGRIVQQSDKNRGTLYFKYSPSDETKLTEMISKDNTASLRFNYRTGRIVEVIDNKNRKSTYQYDDKGNLIKVTDSDQNVYQYGYKNKKFPHLITRIDYPKESTAKQPVYRELGYDENGLTIYHRDRDGVEISYVYGKGKADPENNFWTKTKTKSAKGSSEIFDEFFIKARPDGSKYLHKQLSQDTTGTSTTIFTQCCGKPQQIIKDNVITAFKYYDNGLLKEKISPSESVSIEYDPRWKKVSRLIENGTPSSFEYDGLGNLTMAKRANRKVTLKYDQLGRITQMVNEQAKTLVFSYNDKGKPTLITEKGLGTIRLTYDQLGRIQKSQVLNEDRKPTQQTKGPAAQKIVKEIMKTFQELVELIRPVGVHLVGAAA